MQELTTHPLVEIKSKALISLSESVAVETISGRIHIDCNQMQQSLR